MNNVINAAGLRNFYLKMLDRPSGFAIDEVDCGAFLPEEVGNSIGLKSNEIGPDQNVILEGDKILLAEKFFAVDLNRNGVDICLCSWSSSDGLPYRIHSNRELILMLSGRKPLSVLCGQVPKNENFEEVPEYLFDPYVENGTFVKREIFEPSQINHPSFRGLRYVFYAKSDEAWRINAYILLRDLAKKTEWSEPLIRFEGALLGYTSEQNDSYISHVREKKGI